MAHSLLSDLNVLSVGFIIQALLSVVCIILVYKCAKYFFGEATKQPLKCGSVGRRLGHFEELLNSFSLERSGSGNICLVISLTSKLSLLHQHVRDALVLLIKRQPMLRAVIRALENGENHFEIKDINEVITMLDITTSDVKAFDWQDVWFEYSTKLRRNGLLWRVAILEEEIKADTQEHANTLMFIFNHSCIDGVSCVKFCEQFLHYMNELAGDMMSVEQDVSSLSLLPYFHDIVTRQRIWHSLLRFILGFCGFRPILKCYAHRVVAHLLQTKQYHPLYTQFPPRLDVSCDKGPCRIIVKVFNEIETKKVIQACKENNCTVTGALMAAAHLAFCRLIGDGMTSENKDVKLEYDFAINSNRLCHPKPSEDYLGCFIYMCDEFYMKYIADTDVSFWKVAQNATQQIRDSLRSEGYIGKQTVKEEAMKPRDILNLLDRKLAICLSSCSYFSSLGSFNFLQNHEQQTYKLHECFVGGPGHGVSGTFSHFNHTINDKMTWQIVYDASKVDRCHAEKFAKLCFCRFNDIASGCL